MWRRRCRVVELGVAAGAGAGAAVLVAVVAVEVVAGVGWVVSAMGWCWETRRRPLWAAWR